MASDPIRLFVGADCNNCDLESQAVLEYSIRKHTTRDVQITWMQNAEKGPWSGWQTASARTPFSHFRWSIPAVCNYKGRAIYTDSDFVFMADIGELWDQPIPAPAAMLVRNPEGKTRTCCVLFDCARCIGHIPTLDALRKNSDVQGRVVAYLKAHRQLMAPFAGDWNCIDLQGYADMHDPRIKAIHYSRIEHQIGLKHAIPRLAAEGKKHWYKGVVGPHPRPELQALFDQLLEEATAAGYGIERYRIKSVGEYAKRDFRYRTSQVV